MEEHKEHNEETKEQDKEQEHKVHHEEHNAHKKHHKKKKSLTKSFYTKVYVVLGVALIIFALYNIFQLSTFNTLFDQKLEEAKEAARPAEIELQIITTNSCIDCYDIDAVVDVIESTGVNITTKEELDFSSSKAKSLINKYDIEKVPTIIVIGEIEKSRSLNNKLREIGEEKDGAYIFTKLEPPFIETLTGDTRGKVSLIHLKKANCEDCFDLAPSIKQLSQSGIIFEKQEEIDIDGNKGKDLINKYDIENVPIIIMDKEAEVYPNIVQSWAQLGTIEDDGSFIMREVSPPYYSIEEEAVKGLASLTILEDSSCKECYDGGAYHKPILARLGLVFEEEVIIDTSSSEGQSLIEKYNITKVPTTILTGDIEEYPLLVSAWKGVGTVEDDGSYVFRKVELARKAYKDLIKDKVVEPETTTSST